MTTAAKLDMKTLAGWSLALGIVLILAGVVAIALPFATALALTIFLGVFCAVRGVTEIVSAFGNRAEHGLLLDVLLGLVYLVAGGLLLFYPLEGVLAVTLLLGVTLVFEGIMELSFGVSMRSSSNRWGWLLLDGVVTVALGGLVLWGWPETSVWALGLLFGLALISSGITRVAFASRTRTRIRAEEEKEGAKPAEKEPVAAEQG